MEIGEFVRLFASLIKWEFTGNVFRNLLENCLGNEVVESSCILGQFTPTKELTPKDISSQESCIALFRKWKTKLEYLM